MPYTNVTPPAGDRITAAGGRLKVPDNPVLPFIEGDGTGPDIWRAAVCVFDAAVERAYRGRRRISWFEVYAGEKAFNKFQTWLPDDTLTAFREYLVGIKGPLTTPVGGRTRSSCARCEPATAHSSWCRSSRKTRRRPLARPARWRRRCPASWRLPRLDSASPRSLRLESVSCMAR